MWVNKDEYRRLKNCQKDCQDVSEQLTEYKNMNVQLEKEVKRLAEMVSAEVKDCKIGPWCKDCQHIGNDHSEIEGCAKGHRWVRLIGGSVQYCKKHLHEICPEFELSIKG